MSDISNYNHYRTGLGDWLDLSIPLEKVFKEIENWKQRVCGEDKIWLCWNVNPAWCLLQQKLALEMGWRPVVGSDPRTNPTQILPDSIFIDFNQNFNFPILSFHFPLEFSFLWVNKIAFWHSDLLVRRDKLRKIANLFDGMNDGETAAVFETTGRRNFLNKSKHRYWELIGCTTRQASHSQYINGTGWWRNFYSHINCPSEIERTKRKKYFYDHGSGILYWNKILGGKVINIPGRPLAEGHCSFTVKKDYTRLSPRDARRDLTKELVHNFDLKAVCKKLNLDDLLDEDIHLKLKV